MRSSSLLSRVVSGWKLMATLVCFFVAMMRVLVFLFVSANVLCVFWIILVRFFVSIRSFVCITWISSIAVASCSVSLSFWVGGGVPLLDAVCFLKNSRIAVIMVNFLFFCEAELQLFFVQVEWFQCFVYARFFFVVDGLGIFGAGVL